MTNTTQQPPSDGKLLLAIAEISNICLTLGLTQEQLPIEVERVLIYHLRHFYDLGAMATEKLVWGLRQELQTAKHESSEAQKALRESELEVYKLRQVLYSSDK